MEEKKRNLSVNKRIGIIALAVVLLLIVAVAVFLVVRTKYVKAEGTFNFTNPDPERAAADDGFNIDGKFDESVYADLNWLYLHNTNGESNVDVAMTSYYGKNGIYFAFDNTETTQIYVNPKRASYLNSGLELYLAPYGVTTIDDENAFEIDLLPTGDVTFKRRSGDGNFVSVATTNDIMAWMGTTTKGGEVNTDKCKGYTMEFFIPWAYLDYLGLDVDVIKNNHLWTNLAHITSYNYAGTDLSVDRYWFSFATQKGSDGWLNVTRYFRFNGKGVMDTVPVILQEGEHYTISGSRSVIPHMKAYVTITPEKGYAVSSILCNGEEQIHKVSYNKDGSITAIFKGPENPVGLTISAKAEKVTKGNKTLSGQVLFHKLGGSDEAGDLWIACIGSDGEKEITPDQEGRFELKNMKQGFYTIQAEKKGYYKISRGIWLNRDIETEIEMEYEMFAPETGSSWDIEEQNDKELYQWGDYGTILSVNSYNSFRIEANLRYDAEQAAVADDDTHIQQRTGFRVKFSNGKYWHPDLINENGVMKIQYGKFKGDDSLFEWNTVYTLSEKEIAKFKSAEGIRFTMVREGQYALLYLEDKLVRMEDLGAELKDCTAQVGFEAFSAAAYVVKYDFQDTGVQIPRDLLNGTNLAEGRILLPTGGYGAYPLPGIYTDMDLTLKAMDHPDGTVDPRTDVLLKFANGKQISFSIATDPKGKVIVQSTDAGLNAWAWYGELTNEELAQYRSTAGVPFRVVRKGTTFYLFVNGRSVNKVDLSEHISADTKMQVEIRHWDDLGARIDIPFWFNTAPQTFLFGPGWNFSRQDQGVISTTPYEDDAMMEAALTQRYTDFDMVLKAYNTSYPKSNRVDLLFDFGSDTVSFGVVTNDDGTVLVQSTNQTLQFWTGYGSLTEKELAQFKTGNGINFRVVRKASTFYLLIGERLISKVDLSEHIKADMTAAVTLRYWGDGGVEHKIPFSLKSTVSDATLAELEDKVSRWDTSKLEEGLLTLTHGGRQDYTFAGNYKDMDVTITAKDHPDGTGTPRTALLLEFANKEKISFSIATDPDGKIILQSMDDGLLPWALHGELTKAEIEKYQSTEGIAMRIVRCGTQFHLILGNRWVTTLNLSEYIQADTSATLTLRHWEDEGARIEFPFSISETLPLFVPGISSDVSGQDKGFISVTPDKDFYNGTTTAPLTKKYTDMDMTVKAYNTNYPNESRTDIAFDFGEKAITFCVVTQDNQVFIQSMDYTSNSLNVWHSYGNLTADEIAKYKTEEGVSFRVARQGTQFYLMIGDRLVNKVDLSAHIQADTPAALNLRYWGEAGMKHQIPFSFLTVLGKAEVVIDASEHGTVNSQKNTYDFGEEIVFTITPDTGYRLKNFTVNGEDKMAQVADNQWKTMAAGKKLQINAQFEEIESVSVSFKVTGYKLGKNVSLAGKELTFADEGNSVKATVGQDGRISTELPLGSYQLKAEGYENTTIQVGADGKVADQKLLYKVFADTYCGGTDANWTLNNGHWNLSSQNDGLVKLTNKQDGFSLLTFTDKMTDMDLTFQKVRAVSQANDGASTDIRFDFTNGKKTSFRLINENGTIIVQSMYDDASWMHYWTNWGNLTEAEKTQYFGDGVAFRIVRQGAVFALYIGERQVNTIDLSEHISADTEMYVTIRHFGDSGEAMDIPFALQNQISFPAEGWKLGKSVSLKGKTVTIKNDVVSTETVVGTDGRITVDLEPGEYQVTAAGYLPGTITIRKDGTCDGLKLLYKVFADTYCGGTDGNWTLGHWDLTGQNDGLVKLTSEQNGFSLLTFIDAMTDINLTLQKVRAISQAHDGAATDLRFDFTNGKGISFRLVNENGRIIVQSMDVGLYNWHVWGELTEDEKAQYFGDGVVFRVVRQGTTFALYIGERQVSMVDLSEHISAETQMYVTFRHFGDSNQAMDMPFTFGNQVIIRTEGYRLGKTLSLKGRKATITNGTDMVETVVRTDGTLAADLKTGTYTVNVDGYLPGTITVREDGTCDSLKLFYKVFADTYCGGTDANWTLNNGHWNLSSQNDGLVKLTNQQDGFSLLTFTDKMTDMDLMFQKVRAVSQAHDGASTDIRFDFTNGKGISFRLTNENGTIIVQSMDVGLYNWNKWGELTEAEKTQYFGDGVAFRVVRQGAVFTLYIGERQVTTIDLSEHVSAETEMYVTIRHFGDSGQAMDIPFVLQENTIAAKAAVGKILGQVMVRDTKATLQKAASVLKMGLHNETM